MQEQILDALRRGANAEALALAEAAVASTPGQASAHRLMALALRANDDHAAALASIDQAIALAPDDADQHFQRAGFLLGDQRIDEAQQALARSLGLDPNQFGAYILQAQLALGRGELDEAERLQRLAARIVPEHPWLMAIEGTVALRRGDAERALEILSAAAQRMPDDVQVKYALGFTYLAKGHLAFAEQAFRSVLEKTPEASGLRGLIAELLRRQARHGEAADELAPLLDDPRLATVALRRFAGELELMAGRNERALPPLRAAFAEQPRDPRLLAAMLEAWRRQGDAGEARASLDAALEKAADVDALWQARLALEPGSEGSAAVLARWLDARPDHVPALEARMTHQARSGDAAAANATAARIVALEPGRSSAELRLLDDLLQRDPEAAIARLEQLVSLARNDEARRLLRGWLGMAQDRAGLCAAAVATWQGWQADTAAGAPPLPVSSAPRKTWPEPGVLAAGTTPVAFLWGAPGSGVERLAIVLGGSTPSFRADRNGPNPPADGLQDPRVVARLASGEQDAAALVQAWRAALPARAIDDGQVIDWLPWWDNVLLLALRPHVPEGLLLVALRDPRDMLLDWLAFGAPPPLAMKSLAAAATWLAVVLNQVAVLHEQDLYPHRLLRLDGLLDDPQGLSDALAAALQVPLPVPSPAALGATRFAAGHWRSYAGLLAEPFALLTPVARRLGYPEA